MGFFDSKSSTKYSSVVEDRVNTVGSQDQGKSILTALGGLKTVGGGKKSNTSAVYNVNVTDGGAIDLAGQALDRGFGVTSRALDEASLSRSESINTAMRALDLAEARSGSEGLDLLKSGLSSWVWMIAVVAGAVVLVFYVKGKK